MIQGIDHFFLSIDHAIACGPLTFIFKLITLLGEKGILFLLAAIVLMVYPKYRKFGVCLFGAIACSFLFSNIILKHLIDRPRPFEWNDTFNAWWQAVGAPKEDGSSFPSGHVTAAAAGCTAICLTYGKKWIKASVIWVVLMMISRCYLMAHHPTDVFVGLILGVGCGFAAYFITEFIYDFLHKNIEKKWASWCLYFRIPAVEHAFEVAGEKALTLKSVIMEKAPEIKLPDMKKASKATRLSSKAVADDEEDDYDDDDNDVVETPAPRAKKENKPKMKAPSIPKMPKISIGTPKSTYVGKHEKRD